jgi:hypothetical protein
MYLSGTGVAKDESKAVIWLRKAAEQGEPHAQNILGFLYYTGTGLPKAYGSAANLFRNAAQQGYAPAQANLGFLYERGRGVPLDYVQAYTWFQLADTGGGHTRDAMNALARIMTPKQLRASEDRVQTWLALHGPSQSSDADAQVTDLAE